MCSVMSSSAIPSFFSRFLARCILLYMGRPFSLQSEDVASHFLLLVVTSWSRSMPALLITSLFVAWSRHEMPVWSWPFSSTSHVSCVYVTNKFQYPDSPWQLIARQLLIFVTIGARRALLISGYNCNSTSNGTIMTIQATTQTWLDLFICCTRTHCCCQTY